MQIKKLLSIAMALTLSFGAVQTIGNSKSVSFAAESEDANYIEGRCTLYDKKNHTLTVFGNVTKEEVAKYNSKNNYYTVESIDASSGTVFPQDSSLLFANFKDAKYIDLIGVDTSNVTNMFEMFGSDIALTSLHFDFYTENVTNMGGMFSGCVNLKYLDGLYGLDTSNVIGMSSMFQLCGSITELDLSNFDTSNVEDMSSMFHRCSSLKEIDLDNFDTSKVKSMRAMFGECSSLDTLHLDHFDTSNVISMEGMFGDCTNLKWLDINNFKTTSVIEMNSMFYNCKKLKELDLSSFTLSSKLKTMANMFAYCDNLDTIKVNGNWTHDKVSNVQYTNNMFIGCVNLRGGYGTKYDYAHRDGDYARIDTPAFKGYLTGPSVGGTEIGDTNNDGRVDATDASNILSKYAEYSTSGKTPTSDELAVYDVNGDGKINSVDASCVLSYYTYTQTGGRGTFADYMND